MGLCIHIAFLSLLNGNMFFPNTVKSVAIRNLAGKKKNMLYLNVTLKYFKIVALFKYKKTTAVS